MQLPISLILSRRGPAQMARVAAAEVTLAAGMGGFVGWRRRPTVKTITNYPGDELMLAAIPDAAIPTNFAIRP